jgi:hypothetical protein
MRTLKSKLLLAGLFALAACNPDLTAPRNDRYVIPPAYSVSSIPGLLAYYPLEGDVNDESGNGHHGSVFGAVAGADRFGNAGAALDFDGNDWATVPGVTTDSKSSGTISLWVKIAGPTTAQACGRTDLGNFNPFYCHYNIFGKSTAGGGGLRAQLGGAVHQPWNTFYFQVAGESGFVPNSTYDFLDWHLYTFVWDSTIKRIYRDAILLLETSGSFLSPVAASLFLGDNANPGVHHERLQGTLDELRIYDRALTEAEIQELFNERPLFLHGSGATANPPVLFVDAVSPTLTAAKYKDSPSIKFAGGNIWKEVGTWEAAPVTVDGELVDVSDANLWLGLKNSDDIGTRFDIRIEVLRNGVLVGAGESLCIQGVTRNPSLAKEVTIDVGEFDSVIFDGSSDVLGFRVLTRIGTDGSGGFCGGHSNAVGLRTYFDATSRAAGFVAAVR